MALLTEEQQTVALNALATTLGKDVSEIETILTGDKPKEVDTLVTRRIKTVRDEGNKTGRKQLQEAANKKAKELYGIDAATLTPADEEKGITIEELLDKVKSDYKPEVDPTKLTEEQVKSHPAFITLETTLKTKDTDHQKEIERITAEGDSKAAKVGLLAQAEKALVDYSAIISEDTKIAAAQRRIYLEQLEGVTPKKVQVEGKDTVEFWKDGKRIENDKLFAVTEPEFFKGLVESAFTTKVSEQTSSTGLNPAAGGAGGQQQGEKKFKGEMPKTQEEYDAITRDRTKYTLDERQEVVAYWNDKNKK